MMSLLQLFLAFLRELVTDFWIVCTGPAGMSSRLMSFSEASVSLTFGGNPTVYKFLYDHVNVFFLGWPTYSPVRPQTWY